MALSALRRLYCDTNTPTAYLYNDNTRKWGHAKGTHSTYTCTEPFVSDMITFHDNRLLSNPNAVHDAGDCRAQMAQRTLLPALPHHYITLDQNIVMAHSYSPLLSNMAVDKEWNVTCLIDLEWICALPAEMVEVPYWLTGYNIDELDEDNPFNEFNNIW